MKEKKHYTISVIITAHSEGILIHRTVMSTLRAIKKISDKYSSEIILHVDNPTPSTVDYIENHANGMLKNIRVYKNEFGDLGASRNFSIQQARGKYVATIDADDLMSENWLRKSLDYLESTKDITVAHSEVTVEFEGADSLVIKHGEIDHDTDTLLSVYANRWNSVIVAPRSLLVEEPYSANSPGYGYEDWHLNCRLIARGVHNVLIPKTAIFVRRKKTNSEWLRQIQSMAVLRANPLLSFSSIRAVANPFSSTVPTSVSIKPRDIKYYAKRAIVKYPAVHHIAKRVKIAVKRQQIIIQNPNKVPTWLQNEWKIMHTIDKQVFPSDYLMKHIAVYDTLTEDHKKAGGLYKQLVDSLNSDSYDYLIFAPWLIKGGADQYTINYANTIAALNPEKKVLVVTTLPVESTWRSKLSDSVDFLDFGTIMQSASLEIKYRLMGHIIENSGIAHIHVINSEFGYDFVQLHNVYLKANNIKIIATSFSQSVDDEGRVFGYSHTHVPYIYDAASLITSDNNAVVSMWQSEYGFNSNKLLVHRQPIDLKNKVISLSSQSASRDVLRVLWAARIAPEKQPSLLAEIGILTSESVLIDMYGTVDESCRHLLNSLPVNVRYMGEFNGPESLDTSIYDAYLYTSLFDGMPNSILEMAQAGLPMVASAIGGIPEFIQDNKTGLLVTDHKNAQAYADALLKLAENKELRLTVAKNAYKKLEDDFSPTAYTEQVMSMLDTLDYFK